MNGLIGTFVIICIYIILQMIFMIKGQTLAHTLTAGIYWFVIGFWNIIATVYFEFGSYKYHVGIGVCFCTVGVIYFTSVIVREYYKKREIYARLSNHQ